MSEPLAREISKSYRAVVYWDFRNLVVTSNTDGWYTIVQALAKSDDEVVRRFVPILLNSVPELFKDLSRRQTGGGELVIWR